MSKPRTPKGTRDFLPLQMMKRSFIFKTIEDTFIKYGYKCIETPSMENLDTLTGKYGEEGDRLIFKVLNSGDKLRKADAKSLEEGNYARFSNSVSDKALRYDLTVPFARFVVQHQNEINFPFKRYQIQPVWRADRPQKGRYREFYQCDADVVGSDSLLYEVEQIQIYYEVLSKLGIDHVIHINNRKVLEGVAEVTGQKEKLIDITIALDKLDKIGEEGVVSELERRGLTAEAISVIKPLFALGGGFAEKMSDMRKYLSDSSIGNSGLDELKEVFDKVQSLGLDPAVLNFNITLARGLDYYTGAIFEVSTDMINIGSICGGGRYDDLTSVFGLKNVSGVGISFGADRIYDVMEEANLWPSDLLTGVRVFFINFGEKEESVCLKLLKELRGSGISSDLYPSNASVKKQMKYANDNKVSYVAMIGGDELERGVVNLRDMSSGEQKDIEIDGFVSYLTGSM